MIQNDTLIKAWLEQKRLDLRESQDKVIAEIKKLKWYQSAKELRRVFNTYQIQEFFVDDLLADIDEAKPCFLTQKKVDKK